MEEQARLGNSVEFEKLIADLKAVVRDGQDLLKAGVSGIRSKAEEGLRTTGNKVREHPYRSAGLVFGLGVIVGILAVSMLSGDSDDRKC